MRNVTEFSLFGNNYRCTQFAAALGVLLLCDESPHPVKMLSCTEVQLTDDWIFLNSAHAINAYVTDSVKMVRPVDVLNGLIARVYHENFAFLGKWKPIDIPRRLRSDAEESMVDQRTDPVISMIVMHDKATIKELEEYYSTEDAFKMYDMIAIDNLNRALGAEAAMEKAKQNAKR